MSQKLSNCPDSQTLVDFLLGKLPASEIEDCQRHVANCAPCVDTIHGLKTDDATLDGLSRDAWIASTERNGEQDEAQVVDELINRLGELSGRSLLDTPSKERVLQDRAAEVQRVMERPPLKAIWGELESIAFLRFLARAARALSIMRSMMILIAPLRSRSCVLPWRNWRVSDLWLKPKRPLCFPIPISSRSTKLESKAHWHTFP